MTIDYQRILELSQTGDWDKAHQSVQPYSDELSCLIHAYLHRLEGDISNARYWYRQAGQAMPDNTLEQEFTRLMGMINKTTA